VRKRSEIGRIPGRKFDNPYTHGRRAAVLKLCQLEFHTLTVLKRRHVRLVQCGDMHEYIAGADIGPDKAEAFLAIEPFDLAVRQFTSLGLPEAALLRPAHVWGRLPRHGRPFRRPVPE